MDPPGQLVVENHHLRVSRRPYERPFGHLRVVDIPPPTGDEEMGGASLPEGKAHLTLPVEVNCRILVRPEPGERDGKDDGVDAGREQP